MITSDNQHHSRHIVVTGAAGFIGSNLCRRLLEAGHRVTGIDNFEYGFRRNIAGITQNPRFTFVEADLRDPASLALVSGEILVHLASHKIPRYSTAFPTLEYNSQMLKNCVQVCCVKNMKLVFASTSDVYGKNPEVPYHEGSNLVLGPTTVKRWAYSTSKIYSEQYIIANHEEFGLNYAIVRFFGSYGPHQNLTWWGGPQSGFITAALNKTPIEIHGDGKQTRTFTFIDDTVDALMRVVLSDKSDEEIFNIGPEPDAEISIVGLATTIWNLINGPGNSPSLNFIPYSTFGNYEDVMRRVPDISKIKTTLGFEPRFSLEEGLGLTITWQKEILGLPKIKD